MACWSRGMILVSGMRGPEFNSRTGPIIYDNDRAKKYDLCLLLQLPRLVVSP